jgi:hypothetical protein
MFRSIPMKTRRPLPTVKPSLECLDERILPSASPGLPAPTSLPLVAVASPPALSSLEGITSQIASAVDQWITAVRLDLNIVWQTVAQEMSQEVTYVEQQFDYLLGIAPSAPDPSAEAGPHVGSVGASGNGMGRGSSNGSGSGSGAATMIHSDQNPPLTSTTPRAGRGSGSGGATTAVRENTSTHEGSNVRLQPGSGSGSGEVYTWDPGAGNGSGTGSGSGVNYLASNYKNWLLDGLPQKGPTGTVPGNKPTDKAVFDGAYDQPIVWDQNFTFSTMQLGNSGDQQTYNQKQTINSNVKVELTGQNGNTSIDTEVTSSDFKLQFNDHNQVFQIDKDASITNMDVTGYSDDTILITGGTTTIAAAPGFTENLGVSLEIGANGTLDDNGWNPLTLTSDNLTITVIGPMNIEYGTGSGITLIDSGTHQGDYIHVGGDLTYLGSGNVTNDTFTVPVYIFGNTGVFTLQSKPGQPNGGKLTVIDQSNYVFPDGSKHSVFMDDPGDQVHLFQGT